LVLSFILPVCNNTVVPALVHGKADSVARLEGAMSNKGSNFQADQTLAITMHIRPIGATDLGFVQRAMAQIAPSWSVELHGICVDDATLVLLPADGDDANGPSFMISRESYGFRVDQVHWDVVTEVGVFPALNDVVGALGVRLAFFPDQAVPGSATVH
jgi:hypothetical protein